MNKFVPFVKIFQLAAVLLTVFCCSLLLSTRGVAYTNQVQVQDSPVIQTSRLSSNLVLASDLDVVSDQPSVSIRVAQSSQRQNTLETLDRLMRLQEDFAAELATLRIRTDAAEARITELESCLGETLDGIRALAISDPSINIFRRVLECR